MENAKTQLLKVSENKRFLVKEDDTPFFWLGDTAWELFHKLTREEADNYLEDRSSKGFNVIQAVALAEMEGLTTENAYGRKPLLQNGEGQYDPSMPDTGSTGNNGYSYWDHVDYMIDKADSLGMYIGLLPTWGDKYHLLWGKGPVVFNGENAEAYGKWLGARYKSKNNIIWILGGDRPLKTAGHFDVINSMARGIKAGDGGRHLMTFHPVGPSSSTEHVHDEAWLDFNMVQSGHSALHFENYKMIEADYARIPIKPVLDGEPRYEDHPIGFKSEKGYFDDFDVRQAAYWAAFAGGMGHTYGHNSIWRMSSGPTGLLFMSWKTALNRPGAGQMQYLRKLMESRKFIDSIPDQSLIAENHPGANHLQALRGEDYAFIYNPNGIRMKITMGKISGGSVKAFWYSPRIGISTYIGLYENTGVIEFIPPSGGRNNDWVLVLDDVGANYTIPGG